MNVFIWTSGFLTRTSDPTKSQSFLFSRLDKCLDGYLQKTFVEYLFSVKIIRKHTIVIFTEYDKKIFVLVELEYNQNRRLQIRIKSTKVCNSSILIWLGRLGIFFELLPSFPLISWWPRLSTHGIFMRLISEGHELTNQRKNLIAEEWDPTQAHWASA